MKKKIIIIVAILAALVIGIGIWMYIDIKENKRIDAEAVRLKENLNIEFGKSVKVSDFIENLNRKFSRRL